MEKHVEIKLSELELSITLTALDEKIRDLKSNTSKSILIKHYEALYTYLLSHYKNL